MKILVVLYCLTNNNQNPSAYVQDRPHHFLFSICRWLNPGVWRADGPWWLLAVPERLAACTFQPPGSHAAEDG